MYYRKRNVGIIEFNDLDSKVNVLSRENLNKLKTILLRIASDDADITALFFVSSKKDIFIAGADINELVSIRTRNEAINLCAKGQNICNLIEQLPMPTFAIVNGACIGGGLELALSCDYILATANKKIKLGFPEARLVISPGFGGVHRLEERIGAQKAKRLIETGEFLNAREARKIGIIDRIINALEIKDYTKLLTLSRRHRRPVKPRTELDKKEREILAERIVRKPAKNALSAFLLVNKYKNPPSKDIITKKKLRHCTVIGAGTMGRDIGYLISSKTELFVNITDINKNIIRKAKDYINSIYKDAVKRGILYSDEACKRFRNILFSESKLADCDMVIECITEDVEAKKRLFAKIEKEVREDCIIASNTSCLSVEELGRSLRRRERFIGTHFFNPAYKMKLVEVVPAVFTDKGVLDRVMGLLQQMGRVPVIVKDSRGFLVNRMLLPYLNEAVLMLEEGFSRTRIESAMIDFGMPTGPLELLEKIGIGVAYKASKILEDELGDRMQVPDSLMVWSERKKIPRSKTLKGTDTPDVANRLMRPMKREAELCLQEGIAASRELIDVSLLLGAGFPAFKRIWNI